MEVSRDKEKFFLSLDLGTTSTRAHVIDKNFQIVGGARFVSKLIQDPEGTSELDPDDYFENIVQILKDALKSAKVEAEQIKNLGISCQRATFITWDNETGEPFHNLTTWKDTRAAEILTKANKSITFKVSQNHDFLLGHS
jgi:putative glycerol kinase 5